MNEQLTPTPAHSTEFNFDVFSDDRGIIHLSLFPHARLRLADAVSIIEQIQSLSTSAKALVLVDISAHEGFTSDRETRGHLAGPELGNLVQACAILIGSPMGGFLGNFFLRINKPPYHVKLFTNPDKAVDWLKSLKEDTK